MSPLTLGLDLSLTSTGLVVMSRDGIELMHNIKSSGKKGDGPLEFLQRIDEITYQVKVFVVHAEATLADLDVAVLEAPSHGSKFGNPHERAGLWWQVYRTLWARHIPVVPVAPATRAKYITGNGRADKKVVLEAARQMYDYEIPNDDVADAAGLAAMGVRAFGHPVERDLSPEQIKCFEGVKGWPTRAAA